MQNLAFAQKKFGTGARGVVAKDIARQILIEREQMRRYAVAVAQAQAKQPAPAPTTPQIKQTVIPVTQKVTPVAPTPTPTPQQIKPSLRERIIGLFRRLKFW